MDDDDLDRQPIGDFLAELSARRAAPGAGATAAIEAALAAGLVAMIGRFTTDPEHAETGRDVGGGAAARRDACVAAAAADEEAFSAVADAMKLPRDTDEERDSRRRALSAAQLDAARPPQVVIEAAVELVALA